MKILCSTIFTCLSCALCAQTNEPKGSEAQQLDTGAMSKALALLGQVSEWQVVAVATNAFEITTSQQFTKIMNEEFKHRTNGFARLPHAIKRIQALDKHPMFFFLIPEKPVPMKEIQEALGKEHATDSR